MSRIRIFCVLLALFSSAPALDAQMPIPHELLGRKRSTFKVPRARPWDEENYKYFGGGPDLDCECGGAGHCFHRPAVWTCPHYIVPPYTAKWIVRGEGMGFFREEEDQQNIVFGEDAVLMFDDPLFSMSDFDFDQSLAHRTSVQRNFGHVFGVEAVYFRVHEELEAQRVFDEIVPIEFQAAGLTIPVPAFNELDLLYYTRLQSGELNFRYYYNYHAASAFIGMRWLEIEELFRTRAEGDVPVRVGTMNRMFGGQIGIETQHWVNYGILRIDSSIRGGIYQNVARQTSEYDLGPVSASGTDIAWVGESEVAANFPITKHTYLRVTYRLINVAGIAVAADQINSTDLAIPAAALNNNGDAIYHGWSVGLEAWW